MSDILKMDCDIERYRNPHDSNSHWILKKKFIEENRCKYDDLRLASLAEVFISSRLLGCVYPKETMDLVNKMSENMEYAIQAVQSNLLQRTLVPFKAASQKEKSKLDEESKNCSSYMNQDDEKIQKDSEEEILPNLSQVLSINEDPFADFIIIENSSSCSLNILIESSHSNKVNLAWIRDADQNSYTLTIKGIEIASATNINGKEAKKEASDKALANLRKRCYTIKTVENYSSDFPEVGCKKSAAPPPEEDFSSYGIGFKLLKNMGWDGEEGLGLKKNGVSRLPQAFSLEYDQTSRIGLGMKSDDLMSTEGINKSSIVKQIKEYVRSDSKKDLIFSKNFSKKERAKIHCMASAYNLKSKSVGKGDDRRLILSRKQSNLSLLKDLIEAGGQLGKYKLIPKQSDG